MGFFGRNGTTVGLDIGSGLIKLVAITHGSGGPVLTKVGMTSVVSDAIVEAGAQISDAVVRHSLIGRSAVVTGSAMRVNVGDNSVVAS